MVSPNMRRGMSGAVVAALLLGGVIPATAQDTEACPAKHICIEYEKQIVEIDPALGPYQVIIIETHKTVIESLFAEDSTTEREVVGAGFAANGDTYSFDRLYTEPQDGIFANAELGDVYALGEVDAN